MSEGLAYSIHLGKDGNKTRSAKQKAKSNISGTTSISNHSIQNSGHLTTVATHNLKKYEGNTEFISLIYGTRDITNDVKNVYLKEFETARIEYNNTQTRQDRKIPNYFKDVNKNAKRDLACEIIIELGDMEFWKEKPKEYRYKMEQVYNEQIEDLQKTIPEFKLANAVIHYEEEAKSPHLHIVGVPVKDGYKRGMKKQVAKSLIFTKESLSKLQDKMRECCINSFNKVYNVKYQLKEKQLGRNVDIPVNKMQGYRALKKQQEKNKVRLVQANKKTDLLSEKTDSIEKVLHNLKPSITNKKNFVVPASSVDTIREYITEVRATTKSIKGVNDLDLLMKDCEKDLKKHDEEVEGLKYQIKQQDEKIEELSNDLDVAKDTISKQKDKINFLQKEVDFFKGLWGKLKKFFQEKVRWDKDEHFTKVTDELYNKEIFSKDDVDRIKTGYVKNANKKKKNYEL